jgi:hypothetical protein
MFHTIYVPVTLLNSLAAQNILLLALILDITNSGYDVSVSLITLTNQQSFIPKSYGSFP